MKVKHKGMLIFLAVVSLLLITAATAFASGNVITFTQHFHNATFSFSGPGANPCTGASGTVTLTFNGVAHVTLNTATGTGHITETQAGDFVIVPDDSTQPTFTGHFAEWDGANFNIQNFAATATLNGHGTGSDGSTITFHMLEHFSVSATGVILSFDQMHCG